MRKRFRNQKPTWQEYITKPNAGVIVVLALILLGVLYLNHLISKPKQLIEQPIQGVQELIQNLTQPPSTVAFTPTTTPQAEEKMSEEEWDKLVKAEAARVGAALREWERKQELEKLSNPKIIATELSKVGKLITYESKVKYEDKIVDKSFWGSKTVNIDLTFRFGIAFELKKLKVAEIIDDMVIIQIPMDSAVLEYIEMVDEVVMNGDKSWLVNHFTPDEISVIVVDAQRTTIKRIEKTDEIFAEAVRELKNCLTELIEKLGYKRVVFETI